MLTSQPATCSGVAGTPSPGLSCAAAHASQANEAAATAKQRSNIDIAHRAGLRDAPALNRVVVITVRGAARADQRGTRRLHGARLVDGAAHQHARAAVPAPWHAKARQRQR